MDFNIVFDVASKGIDKVLISFDDLKDTVEKIAKDIIDLGSDFENSFSKVTTLVDEGAISLNELSSGILDLSNTFGKSVNDINSAAYQALSASVDSADLLDVLNTAQKSSVAGFTDTETAIDGLTNVINSYGFEIEKADYIANAFLVTQNLGKTTFGELANSIGQVAPLASQLGVSIEDVLSSVAALTAQGVSTSEAITNIRSSLTAVMNPSKEAADTAKSLGIEFNYTTLKSMGYIDFLNYVKDAVGEDSEALNKLFGRVQAVNGVLGLTSDTGSKKVAETLNAITNETNALDDAFNKMSDTLSFKFDKVKTVIENIGILSFDKIKDSLKDFVGYVDVEFNSLYDKLANTELGDSFYESINELIVVIKEFVSVFISDIPDIIPIITNIINMFKNVLDNIKNLVDFLSPIVLPVLKVLSTILSETSEGLFVLLTSLAIFNKTTSISYNAISKFSEVLKNATTVGSKLNTEILKLCPLFNELTSGATTAGAAIKSMLSVELTGAAAVGSIAVVIFLVVELFSTLVDLGKEAAEVKASILTGPDYAKYAEDFKNAVDAEKESLDNLLESQEKINDADNANIDNLQRLWSELENYVDSNGNVIDCNERAVAIIDLLNTNYGLNIDYQNGMIMGYQNLAGSMDNYIEKLREEALIRNMQPVYDEAVSMKYNYEKQKRDLESDIKLTEASLYAAVEKFREAERGSLEEETAMAVMDTFQAELDMQKAELEALDEGIANAESTMNEFEDLFKNHTDNVENIVEDSTEAIERIASLSSDEIKRIKSDYLNDLKRSQEDALFEQQQLWDKEKEDFNNLQQEKLDSIKDYYDEQKDLRKKDYEDAKLLANAEYNVVKNKIDSERQKRENQKLVDKINKKKQEISKYGDYNLLVTSADRQEYKKLQSELESLEADLNEKLLQQKEDAELKSAEVTRDVALKNAEDVYNNELKKLEDEKNAAIKVQEEINFIDKQLFEKTQNDKKNIFKRAQEDYKSSFENSVSEALNIVKDGGQVIYNETDNTFYKLEGRLDDFITKVDTGVDEISYKFKNAFDSSVFDNLVSDFMNSDYINKNLKTGLNMMVTTPDENTLKAMYRSAGSGFSGMFTNAESATDSGIVVNNYYYTPVVDETVRSQTRANMFNSGLDSSIYN